MHHSVYIPPDMVEEFEGDRRPRRMLFDLDADPDEKNVLVAERPELAAAFHKRVAALRRRYQAIALPRAIATPDARSRALLEKLGYLE